MLSKVVGILPVEIVLTTAPAFTDPSRESRSAVMIGRYAAGSLSFLCAGALSACGVLAQSASPDASVQQGIQLVETGRCTAALPLLEHGIPHVTDKSLRYRAEMAEVRCAMAVDNQQLAADALFRLQREFPGDPEVLYIQTHMFSQLAMRAAQELQQKDPASYQARRLQAESLESQGKEEDAAAIYRNILKDHPNVPGIHYHLGQIALAQAGDAGPTDAAQAEFEKELSVDPSNASAEFILGELARRKGDWSVAIQHFTQATHLDVGFSEAYLALGMSLAAAGRYADAKPPLGHYVQLEPDDPSGYYQLAIADAHTGDQAGARREMDLQQQAAARAKATNTTEGHPVQQ
jgi:tetratricopeptide (TPR) repeat protein